MSCCMELRFSGFAVFTVIYSVSMCMFMMFEWSQRELTVYVQYRTATTKRDRLPIDHVLFLILLSDPAAREELSN